MPVMSIMSRDGSVAVVLFLIGLSIAILPRASSQQSARKLIIIHHTAC